MKACLYWIKMLTYHAHRRQNILVSPQDRLACPIQHLLRYSKAAPGQGEMQMPPKCNSSAHQLEFLTALVLREVGVTSFHIEFELYSPDDKHVRVAQLALPSLPTFFTRDTISVFFEMSGWLAMTRFPLKAFLETALEAQLRFHVADFRQPQVLFLIRLLLFKTRPSRLESSMY